MMLMIQGQTNLNYLSLAERLNVASGYQILVRFLSEDSLYDTSVVAVTASGSHAYRYHTLTITEKDNATANERQAGYVSLNPYGTFLYEVYQQSISGAVPIQAAGVLNFVDFPENGDTFTIHFPATDSDPAFTVTFTFKTTPTEDTDIAISPTDLDLQGFLFAQVVGPYLETEVPESLFLSSDPPVRTEQTFSCGGEDWTFAGALGNQIYLTWDNPAIFSQTSPLYLTGGDDGINLDPAVNTTLLERGKCLVTKNTGFDTTQEYGGQSSFTPTYAPREDIIEAPEIISGCTDPDATNYNPLANFEDGSCTYPGAILGCTDSQANNYNPAATEDDGTCTYDAAPAPNYTDIICADFDMTTVEYMPGFSMDLYEETCNANTQRPVVIVLHPGGGTRTSFDVVKYAKDFASRGYLGIAASYGDTDPYTTARQKENIARVAALIRFLRANDTLYGIKKENIFVMGISAGALTSLGVNVASNDIDNGVSYWDNAMNSLNDSESSVPRATATQSGAIINAMAAYINAGDRPNYFYHGTLDTTMDYTKALSEYNTMIGLSIASTFVPYVGAGHSIGSHHDNIIAGGDTLIDGVSIDTGLVVKFANLLI